MDERLIYGPANPFVQLEMRRVEELKRRLDAEEPVFFVPVTSDGSRWFVNGMELPSGWFGPVPSADAPIIVEG